MQGDTSRLWVKMDIEMQIIKAYVKENNYVSQKLCWYCEKICYMMQYARSEQWLLVYSFFLMKCFTKFPVMTYCRRNAHLISPVRRITLNRHCISLEKFVTVHGLLSSFRFESVGSPINCHAPIWQFCFSKI